MWLPEPSDIFQYVQSSPADGTRPTNSWGTAVTPLQNAYTAAWTNVLGVSSYDAYAIELTFSNTFAGASSRDTLVKIGIDPAGGTAYTDRMLHLLASACGAAAQGTGEPARYRFPLFFPAGTTFAAKASQNHATPNDVYVAIRLFCKPRLPVWAGQGFDAIGANTAASAGTSFTPGLGTEGAWTSLGAAQNPYQFCDVGMGIDNTAVLANVYHLDIAKGDASNKHVIMHQQVIRTTSSETLGKAMAGAPCQVWETATSAGQADTIYMRGQVGGNNSPGGESAIFYGVY